MSDQTGSKISISEREAREIESTYDNIIGILKEASVKTDTEVITAKLIYITDFIIKSLTAEYDVLLLYTSKIFDKDYIFAHSLNVSIISIKIGLRLGFDKERLKNLGLQALIHAREDMGLPEEVLKGIGHDKESDEIVRLADVYDALTHPPSYRHARRPDETLKEVINTDKFFDPALIKILIEELSLYPRGSWVQLCTREIAKVIKVNREQCLRPTVEVFIDEKGGYLKETKTIDLAVNALIYVIRALTEEDIIRLEIDNISAT